MSTRITIDPRSLQALERAESMDKSPIIDPAPTGDETQPGSLPALSPTDSPVLFMGHRVNDRLARLRELRAKAAGRLAYLEFTIPEFAPLTPNIRRVTPAHTAWLTPELHQVADRYPTGKLANLILWDYRPDGSVTTATSDKPTIRAAYADCDRQLRLKRHDTAVLLRKLEALQLVNVALNLLLKNRNQAIDDKTVECGTLGLKVAELEADLARAQAAGVTQESTGPTLTCCQCDKAIEDEKIVCLKCYTDALPHPHDDTTLAILRRAWPKLTREGGHVAMLTDKDQFRFYRNLCQDLANPRLDRRSIAWQAVMSAHTGRLTGR